MKLTSKIFKSISRESRYTAGIVIGLIILWQLAEVLGWVKSPFLPSPSDIIWSAVGMFRRGELQPHLSFTLSRLFTGFLIGTATGVLVGLAMGWSKTLRLLLDPVVTVVYPIPKIAILPLIMMLLGIGEQTIIFVIALSAFFPVLINTIAGVININPVYFDIAKNYGASRGKLFTKVILPGSLPMIFAGIRLALGMSLLMVVVVELAMSTKGLGAMLWLSWATLRIERIYVAIFIIAILSLIFNPLLKLLAKHLAPWQDEEVR
jgi:ABC-type nitrate/sulfonate/bicarbonate transport system permease component